LHPVSSRSEREDGIAHLLQQGEQQVHDGLIAQELCEQALHLAAQHLQNKRWGVLKPGCFMSQK
jgi:hypothetical protein